MTDDGSEDGSIKISDEAAEELLKRLNEIDDLYPETEEFTYADGAKIFISTKIYDTEDSNNVDIESVVSELQSDGVDPSEVLTFSVPETVQLSTQQRRLVIIALTLGMYNFLISAVAAFYGELQIAGGFSAVAGLAWISSGLIRYWPSRSD